MRANYGAQKVIDKSLPATAPSAHSGFSEGSPGLYVIITIIIIIGTSVCDDNHSLTIVTQVVAMVQRRKIVHYKPECSKFDSG